MDALILSYALDTNGQNARFVQAARKFGQDPSIISALAIGNTDPGGVIARMQIAADKLGGLEIRSAHRAEQYFQFPNDILWTRHTEPEIRILAAAADVIHLNNSHMAYKRLRLNKKPALLHHHGSMFRGDPNAMHVVARQYKMVEAVSTPDLLQYGDDLHWLPTAYDVDALEAYGRTAKCEPDGRIRLVHAPTNRTLKHTEVLLAAVDALVKEGLPLDLILVEGQTWAECMKAKAQADIVFDQLAYGYGCNAVEAWGMGIPVISGSDPWTSAWMHREWGDTPYAEATPETLVDVLRVLVTDEAARKDAAAKGMAHVRKYHDERPALTKLAELYGMAIEAHAKPIRIPGKGVTFRNKTDRLIQFDGETLLAGRGDTKITDPDAIRRLRYLASRPAMGVEEVA